MSYSITRETDFCYGHRLPGNNGKCRFLHGHNGHAEITLSADSLNENGMVTDFGEIRTGIENWINEELDHHVILSREDPLVEILQEAGQQIVVMDAIPTAENIAALIFQQGRKMGLNITQVSVWETAKNRATFRETGHHS